MNFSLEGKNAVVTGGAQGLGQAICHALAKAGCNVAIADMKDEAAQATAAEVAKATGRKAFALKTDVTQETDVEKLFDRTVKEFGDTGVPVLHQGRYDSDNGTYVYVDSAATLGVTLELLHSDPKR